MKLNVMVQVINKEGNCIMKRAKAIGLTIIILANTIFCSGCWNYREIEKLAIVAGMAIDRDEGDRRFIMTVEIASTLGEASGGTQSEVYETRGTTMFEAVRNLIIETGKKAYWSHSKVIIIGRSIAEDGIAQVLDFVYRDSETRRDVLVVISNVEPASAIIKEAHNNKGLLSFKLDSAIRSQKSISRFPKAELRAVVDNFKDENSAMLLPIINKNEYKNANNNIPEVFGSAVLKHDKVVGYLNGDETKYALWVQNKLKGGLLIVRDILEESDISFEIFTNKTRRKIEYKDNQFKVYISTKTEVNIGELSDTVDFSDPNKLIAIKSKAEKFLEKNIKAVITRLQKDYKADVFNFQEMAEIHDNKEWKKVKSNWSEVFASIPFEVDTEINIKGTALTSKPIKEGE
jgi:spore germination protein KC